MLKWQLVKLRGLEVLMERCEALLPVTEQVLQHLGGEIREQRQAESWKQCGDEEEA